MGVDRPDEEVIRAYLLGKGPEETLSKVEERFMTDDAFYDESVVVEDELIDDYLAGVLSPDESQSFSEYFLASPERQHKLRFAAAFRGYVSKASESGPETEQPAVTEEPDGDGQSPTRSSISTNTRGFQPGFVARILRNPYIQAAATMVIIVGVGLAVYRGFYYQSEVNEGIQALNELYKAQRPEAVRIAVLKYAKAPGETRGSGAQADDTTERDRVRIIAEHAYKTEPGAQSAQLLGDVYLAESDFDRAIDKLGQAAERDPKSAQIQSDLGAAYFLRARHKDSTRADDLNQSLEHLNRAINLDPTRLEALFNRALLYEEMKNYAGAEADWKNYLVKDGGSLWAQDARGRLNWVERELR